MRLELTADKRYLFEGDDVELGAITPYAIGVQDFLVQGFD